MTTNAVQEVITRGNCPDCDGTGDSRKIPHPVGAAWNSMGMGCRTCKATGEVRSGRYVVTEVRTTETLYCADPLAMIIVSVVSLLVLAGFGIAAIVVNWS